LNSFTDLLKRALNARKKNKGAIVFLGYLFLIGSIFLLWFNESRAVATARGLEEGQESVIEISSAIVDEKNEGKLVYVTGVFESSDILFDKDFGIQSNDLKLSRKVEMYQWEEKKGKSQDLLLPDTIISSEYSYEKTWSTELISSSNFKHKKHFENPSSIPLNSYATSATNVKMGAFNIPQTLLDKIENEVSLSLQNTPIKNNHNGILVKDAETKEELIYIGNESLDNPQIGDLKVTFSVVQSGIFSLIAQQTNTTFKPFTTSKETLIELISPGKVSANELFAASQQGNTFLTWVFRIMGIVFMFFGMIKTFEFEHNFASNTPILGNIINQGVFVYGGLLTFVFSSLTIVSAWIIYRPILAVIVVSTFVVTILFLIFKGKNK